jgi:2-deoxy-D-gluconate 3-dehydrogenase
MLGRGYAETLLGANARVALADLASTSPGRIADGLSGDHVACIGIETDITVPRDVSAMVSSIMARWGRIDILVNNAAIDPKFDESSAGNNSARFEDYPLSLWQRSIDVNLTGAFLCSQSAGRVMAERGSGAIVNIASTYGIVAPDQRLYDTGDPGRPFYKPASYAVTTAGIAQLTRYLASYWGRLGIRVNTLTPGGVFNRQDQKFVEGYAWRTMLGRMARADELRAALLFLVSDASSYMTGSNLIVDGGWSAW